MEKEREIGMYVVAQAERGYSIGETLGIEPDKAEVAFEEGLRAFEQKDYIKASERALLVALAFPEHVSAWMLLGSSLSLRGLHDEAIHCYEVAAEADLEDPYPHYYAAGDYIEMEDHVSARECLDKALELAKKHHRFRELEDKIIAGVEK